MKNQSIGILIWLIVTMIACKNQYSNYGSKNPVETKDLTEPVYTGDGKAFTLNFINNPYHINNRIVIVRLNTTVVYRATFSMFRQRIIIPANMLNKSCSLSIVILEPSSKEGYYFENKDGLDLLESDSVLKIEFTKSKDFYNHVIFKTK